MKFSLLQSICVKNLKLNLIIPPDLIIKLNHIKWLILDHFELQKYNFTSFKWIERTEKNVISESESHSVMSFCDSPWNSPDQNTGVDRLSLLQGIVPTQGSNPGLLHCKRILYQLSHKGSPRMLVVRQLAKSL